MECVHTIVPTGQGTTSVISFEKARKSEKKREKATHKMSRYNRRDYGTEASMFSTGLYMGLENSKLRFYTGEEDDEIGFHGGKFLSINGVFLNGSNRYALIEYACVPIYFADGG